MRSVNLSKIKYDPQYYPRVNGKEDWMTVLQYKEALEADPTLADSKTNKDAFPPIVVVTLPNGFFLLIDGLHRMKAFIALGLETIYAEVEQIPKSKWLVRSVELNIPNGRRLDNGDKAWVAQRLEAEGMSKKQIASLLKMQVTTLEKMVMKRAQRLTIKEAKDMPVGRSNRKVNGKHFGFLKSPLQAAANTDRAIDALRAQHSLSNRTVVQVLDSAIAIFKAGVVDTKDEEVAGKVKELKELMEPVLVL